jgi:hypothetical protein
MQDLFCLSLWLDQLPLGIKVMIKPDESHQVRTLGNVVPSARAFRRLEKPFICGRYPREPEAKGTDLVVVQVYLTTTQLLPNADIYCFP